MKGFPSLKCYRQNSIREYNAWPPLLVFLYNHTGIVPAKTKRIAQCSIHRCARPQQLLQEKGIAGGPGHQALTQLGMHPILQMHYQMVLKPYMAAHMTVRHYPELVEGC